MKTVLMLILVLAVAIGAYWYFVKDKPLTLENVKEEMADGARKVGDAIDNLDTDEIREELARTGRVVREKAGQLGEAVKDVSADAQVTAAIKAKYVANPELSAFAISVDTTDGVVTLAGTVPSHEAVKEAIRLALETDGVEKVVSTLQVSPPR